MELLHPSTVGWASCSFPVISSHEMQTRIMEHLLIALWWLVCASTSPLDSELPKEGCSFLFISAPQNIGLAHIQSFIDICKLNIMPLWKNKLWVLDSALTCVLVCLRHLVATASISLALWPTRGNGIEWGWIKTWRTDPRDPSPCNLCTWQDCSPVVWRESNWTRSADPRNK